MTDKFEVGAIRGEIEAMVAGKFEGKFPYEKIDAALETINDRYKDDEACKMFSHIYTFVGEILMMINRKKREIKHGKTKTEKTTTKTKASSKVKPRRRSFKGR